MKVVNSVVVAWWLLAAAILTGAGPRGGDFPVPSIPATRPISPDQFGLVFVNSAETLRSPERIRRGVATGARLDRFPLYWHFIETAPNTFEWSRQDAAIRADEAQGLGVLAVLLGVPAFYSSGSGAGVATVPLPPLGGSVVRSATITPSTADRRCGPAPPVGLFEPIFSDGTDEPGPGKAVNPDNPWAHFVAQAVERYRPGGTAGTNVRFWEIWNEPDLCQFWNGSVEAYARLLKVAYLVIKQDDPDATVLWGGLAHYEQPDFLPTLVNILAQDPLAEAYNGFFDAAASHQYSASWLGYRYTKRVRETLASVGWADKPIWITESGVPVCDDYPGPPCPSPYRATPQEQAAYIWQNIAYTRMAGGGPIFHFQLHDDCGNVIAPNSPDGFGLRKNEPQSFCSPANAEPRPAYTAFQVAVRYLESTEFLWADMAGPARRVAFYEPTARERRLMVWNTGGRPFQVRVPATGTSGRLVALDGSERLIEPLAGEYRLDLAPATNQNFPGSSLYTIGGPPVLIVEEDTRPPTATVNVDVVSPLTVPVAWSVRDLGSGVASVEVWVQPEGGTWQMWRRTPLPEGQATFEAPAPGRYAFGVVAEDRAGNRNAAPAGVVQTLATDDPPRLRVSGQVVDVRGRSVPYARVKVGDVSTFARDDGRFVLSVPAGRWDVRVQERLVRRGVVLTAPLTLTLLFSPNPSPVRNGDFEQDLTAWELSGSTPATVERWPGTQDHRLRLAPAFVPDPCGCVPGEDGSVGGNSTVSQRVRLPDGSPVLALWYGVESAETEPGHDKFEIIVVDQENRAHYLYVQETSSLGGLLSLDLSAFAGQEVRLIFNLYQSSPQRPTTAWVDWVTVGQDVPVFLPPISEIFLPFISR
ncbi:MAG: hypothetical protein Q9O62_01735 [Ardenticatenia bacterium]|nr:hypothetical protein [Ardenticatenia bacterium]